MTQEPAPYTYYLVMHQGRIVGRNRLQYAHEDWQRQVLTRRYKDLHGAAMVEDPDQRDPNRGGAPIGRYAPGPSLADEVARLVKQHGKAALRAAVEALP